MIGAVIGALTNALKKLGKGIGNGLQTIGKKIGFYSPRPHRLDRKLHFPSRRAGHFLSSWTHLAVDSCCGCLSDGTVPQAQKLTLQTNRPAKTTTPTTISVLFTSWLVSLGLGRVVTERGASYSCAFIAALWIGLEGWLFCGLIINGPSSMRCSRLFCVFTSLFTRASCLAWPPWACCCRWLFSLYSSPCERATTILLVRHQIKVCLCLVCSRLVALHALCCLAAWWRPPTTRETRSVLL